MSLLGYLLVHRGVPQPRQRLAFLLWPDSTEAQARTNLRKVLHTLRRALPDADRFIEVTPTHAALARGRARTGSTSTSSSGRSPPIACEEAVDAYAGDLIEGSYDDWVLEERERLRDRYLDALERLRRRLEEREEWAAAIRCAERLAPRRPAARGRAPGADAPARRARRPSARAARLSRVRRDACSASSASSRRRRRARRTRRCCWPMPNRDRRAPARPRRPGRRSSGARRERARLAALWRSARRGSAQLVLVTGEPGIGKSRLVEELRSWCAHAGAVCAEARAYPAEGAVAYGPVVAWLRSDAIGGAAAPPRSGRPRPSSSRLLPELRRCRPARAAARGRAAPAPLRGARPGAAGPGRAAAAGRRRPAVVRRPDAPVPALPAAHGGDGAAAGRGDRAARGDRPSTSGRRAGRRAAGARALHGDRARTAEPRRDRPARRADDGGAARRGGGRAPVRRVRGQPALPRRGRPGRPGTRRRAEPGRRR